MTPWRRCCSRSPGTRCLVPGWWPPARMDDGLTRITVSGPSTYTMYCELFAAYGPPSLATTAVHRSPRHVATGTVIHAGMRSSQVVMLLDQVQLSHSPAADSSLRCSSEHKSRHGWAQTATNHTCSQTAMESVAFSISETGRDQARRPAYSHRASLRCCGLRGRRRGSTRSRLGTTRTSCHRTSAAPVRITGSSRQVDSYQPRRDGQGEQHVLYLYGNPVIGRP